MPYNIPKAISMKREELVKKLGLSDDRRICFELGFDECAKILIAENRRVSKLNQDLMNQFLLIKETISTRRGDWE